MRRGLSTFTLVGLPDRAVRESRERVRAALLNSGLDFPQKRITVNLAPAHVRKEGPSFDLAIAVGVLAASGQVPQESLAGARCAASCRSPASCGRSAARSPRRSARGAAAIAACSCRRRTPPRRRSSTRWRCTASRRWRGSPTCCTGAGCPSGPRPSHPEGARRRQTRDLSDVRGQDDAKRALEIAAAGGHNLLMIGPPGAGKTMLARRLPGMLPPPTFEEALEVTQVHGAAGIGERPARHEAPVPRAPPHDLRPGSGRGRQPPDAGRDHACPPQGPLISPA